MCVCLLVPVELQCVVQLAATFNVYLTLMGQKATRQTGCKRGYTGLVFAQGQPGLGALTFQLPAGPSLLRGEN